VRKERRIKKIITILEKLIGQLIQLIYD
jgi:hypothetical protein